MARIIAIRRKRNVRIARSGKPVVTIAVRGVDIAVRPARGSRK